MTKKLWGSRFQKGTNALADHFTFSIAYDKRLAIHDVEGSIAHAQMLGKCRIIPVNDAQKIITGLKKIASQIKTGKFAYDMKAEDIHTNVQNVLKKLIGSNADKLHTARSRNDQVALDIRLYCRTELKNLDSQITTLQKSILKFAESNKDVIIPAYTHLQSAQVVLLAHHMLAYLEMLERDKARLADAIKRINVLPLGSCALSGTTLAIDRNFVAKQLSFSIVNPNSMDAVSDRDFVMEILAALAILGVHFSRIAEDLILWATQEFHFVDIDWAFCTGSSIMPHKKNPDVLELIRGKAAQIQANFVEITTLMKALPLTYNRDMQLDKPPLFESMDSAQEILQVLSALFASLKVQKNSIERKIHNELLFSVDMMEYLIKKGLAYREAHDVVGKIVKECIDKGKSIHFLSLSDLKKYSPLFKEDVKKILEPTISVQNKKSFGSTNPVLVKKQLSQWKGKLHA